MDPAFNKLLFLVPTDFFKDPVKYRAQSAAISTAFPMLWHPDLLAGKENLPRFILPADLAEISNALLLVTAGCQQELDNDRLAAAGVRLHLIPDDQFGETGRAYWRKLIGLPESDPTFQSFHRVGFAYFALRLLLGLLEHDDPIDEWSLLHELQQASEARNQGDTELCKSHLQASFDSLHNARNLAFPSTINLIDLALWFDRDADWTSRLAYSSPLNLLASGEEIDRLAERWPERLAALRSAIDAQHAELLGGTYDRLPWALISHSHRCWQLERAGAACRQHFSRELDTFATIAAALTPSTPQLINKFQLRYALHQSFAGTKIPFFRQPKLNWSCFDYCSIESLCRSPSRADDEHGFFDCLATLAKSLRDDRSTMLFLAHWIGDHADWLEEWLAVSEFSPILGRFCTLADFFLGSGFPDHQTSTHVEEYHSNALETAIANRESNPVSRWIDLTCRRADLDRAMSLQALAAVAGSPVEIPSNKLAELEKSASSQNANSAKEVADLADQAAEKLAATIGLKVLPGNGFLVLNPGAFPRRATILLPGVWSIPADDPVRVVQQLANATAVVVDVPGWGFSYLAATPAPKPASASNAGIANPVASGRRLRNEFIEVEVDSNTGGLRGIWDHKTAFSRFGQQLAFGPGSRPIAKKLDITSTGPAFGEIITTGEIQAPDRKVIAKFEQRFRLWRGRPTLDLAIKVDLISPVKSANPEDFFVARWAWPDEKTSLNVLEGSQMLPHRGQQVESAWLLDFRERNLRTTLITNGLSFHRRLGPKIAESFLIAPGEERREFEFQISLDSPRPQQLAQECLQKVAIVPVSFGTPAGGSNGWLARLTGPQTWVSEFRPATSDPNLLHLRMHEITGKPCRAELRFARPPKRARLVSGRGDHVFDLYPQGDLVPADFSSQEFLQIEIGFDEPPPASDGQQLTYTNED